MKKILHISNYYPPHIGGIEDVCHSIVAGMSGYEHCVICFNDKPFTERGLYEGVEVVRCGVWKKLFSQSISFSFFRELRNILRDFKPDIVHFHTPNPLSSVYLLALLPKNAKLIVHWHSDIVAQGLLHFFYAPFEACLLNRADKILITSPTYLSGSKPLRKYHSKITVIPNTVDAKKLDKRPEDAQNISKIKELCGNRKIVFTFGRHVPYKGLQYLVDSLGALSKDAVVVIAGVGALTGKLKAGSSIYPVLFPGRLSEEDLRAWLYAADVFAFPSVTRNEAFGIALAEAMYCGLPAVTFTIPDSGVNWVCIDGEDCIESENGNSSALAAAINRLLDDDELRLRLGKNASERVRQNFVIESITGELRKIYDNI
ncbi:MAG: glycosyltransferase [Dysgonamonadaceae bacterium]|jgi:glycosyltransferase involved in cell wall biosynthesis|nr:glycosyltransferase [Dysgonamonadaceae bacterium]